MALQKTNFDGVQRVDDVDVASIVDMEGRIDAFIGPRCWQAR